MPIEPDPTAVMGRRIGAAAIDVAVVFVPFVVYQTSQLTTLERASTDDATDYCERFTDEISSGVCVNVGSTVYYDTDADVAPSLTLLGLTVLMFVVLQGLTGWTLGKLVTGIRTVRATDGQVPGIGKALVRWLLWIVDSLPIFWLVGIVTAATSTGHRRVGDMAAGTLVVRADAAGQPVAVPGMTVPEGAFPPPSGTTGIPAPSARPGPQWDEARGTYIQWDPEVREWMQWDDAAKRWDPIAVPAPTAPAPPPPPPPPPPPS